MDKKKKMQITKEIDASMKAFLKDNVFSGNILVSVKGEKIVEQSYGMSNY